MHPYGPKSAHVGTNTHFFLIYTLTPDTAARAVAPTPEHPQQPTATAIASYTHVNMDSPENPGGFFTEACSSDP